MAEKQSEKSILDILSFDAVLQEAEEIEIDHICLRLYEDIEKEMNELGIHIMLNVYEGAANMNCLLRRRRWAKG